MPRDESEVTPHRAKTSSGAPSNVGAGVAGASGGALLITLIGQLPIDESAKSLLVLLCPTATILISGGWIWTRTQIESMLAQRVSKRLAEALRQRLQAVIADTSTSEGHRNQLRAELEELDRLMVRADFDRIKALIKK